MICHVKVHYIGLLVTNKHGTVNLVDFTFLWERPIDTHRFLGISIGPKIFGKLNGLYHNLQLLTIGIYAHDK